MRKTPSSAEKIATLPSGVRIDRASAILRALTDNELEPERLALYTLSDGSIAIYKARYGKFV